MQHIFFFLVFLDSPTVSSLARVRKFCWQVQVVPYKVANELKGATNSASTTYSYPGTGNMYKFPPLSPKLKRN